MQRRSFVRGGLVSGVAALVGCRRGPTDLPIGPGAPPVEGRGRADAGPHEGRSERFESLTGFCDGVAPPDSAEFERHIERLQRRLVQAGQAALVAEPSATMTWLSGVHWGRSERPFLIVVPAQGEPRFVCPAFEEGSARERLAAVSSSASLELWQEHENPYSAVARVVPRGRGTIAVDGEVRSFVATGLRGALPGPLVDGSETVDACRMRKSDAELSRLRRANEATKAALQMVAPYVHEGMPQSDIVALVQAAQLSAGLVDIWALALAGPNAAFPHGNREDRRVVAGDLVLVDTGGALHGYRSDITRTWAVGTPDAGAAKAWQVVADAQRAALAVMGPGRTCGAVDSAARAVIAEAGYGGGYEALTHRLGHGIGLQVHEAPYLRPDNTRVLQPGMTMSNEPGIYRRGEFGVRLEDIVAITKDGVEVFGPLPKSLEQPFG